MHFCSLFDIVSGKPKTVLVKENFVLYHLSSIVNFVNQNKIIIIIITGKEYDYSRLQYTHPIN